MKKNPILIAFGKRLIELRESKGISQERLANDSDMSISSISKIERGLMNVSLTNINKLANSLGVDVRVLLE